MRAVQAEQYFLEEAGRSKEAEQLNDLLDLLRTSMPTRRLTKTATTW